MNQTDERAFKAMPSPAPSQPRRRPTRFEIWAWSQVRSFQIGLTASYLAAVYFGVSSAIATSPALISTSPRGYAFFWALALAAGGCVGALGSVIHNKPFERLEFIGSSMVSLTVGSYASVLLFIAYGLGDTRLISAGAGFVTLTVPFLVRTLWLASQVLRK